MNRERIMFACNGEIVHTVDLSTIPDIMSGQGGAELLVQLRAAIAKARRDSRREPLRGCLVGYGVKKS